MADVVAAVDSSEPSRRAAAWAADARPRGAACRCAWRTPRCGSGTSQPRRPGLGPLATTDVDQRVRAPRYISEAATRRRSAAAPARRPAAGPRAGSRPHVAEDRGHRLPSQAWTTLLSRYTPDPAGTASKKSPVTTTSAPRSTISAPRRRAGNRAPRLDEWWCIKPAVRARTPTSVHVRWVRTATIPPELKSERCQGRVCEAQTAARSAAARALLALTWAHLAFLPRSDAAVGAVTVAYRRRTGRERAARNSDGSSAARRPCTATPRRACRSLGPTRQVLDVPSADQPGLESGCLRHVEGRRARVTSFSQGFTSPWTRHHTRGSSAAAVVRSAPTGLSARSADSPWDPGAREVLTGKLCRIVA